MAKNLAILFFGFAVGFATAALLEHAKSQEDRESAEGLSDSIESRLDSLETSLKTATA